MRRRGGDSRLRDAAGELAGFCFVDVDTPELGYVASLGVRPRHRGLGLGAALLAHAIATLHTDGVRDVHLHVDADNPTGATGLYERMGFAPRFTETRYTLDDAAVRTLARRWSRSADSSGDPRQAFATALRNSRRS